MRLIVLLMTSFVLLVLNGCLAGQPSPPTFMLWKKAGVEENEVMVALLECGANNPSGDSKMFPYPAGKGLESYALVERCMQGAGFRAKKSVLICKSLPNLDACGDRAIVPIRNTERRLNSAYCKHYIYSTYPACKP
jgi:hypothetical protein